MRFTHFSTTVLVLSVFSFLSSPRSLLAASTQTGMTARTHNFDQALERAEGLSLPINKVFLYREAATALIPVDRPRAIALLNRALSDIDAAEAEVKLKAPLDDATLQQLEFHRLPVLMLMERIDTAEACNLLEPPQSADKDMTFQSLFFERLKDPEIVRQVALRKLAFGVTPAVIAAYGVLKTSAPEVAKSLVAAIVLKLAKTDPATDPEAVHSAFLLIHVLRTDVGALAPEMVFNPDLLEASGLRDLFSFIGDAFLASKDPEDLILGSRPQLYLSALETYAPEKAQYVKLLSFAAPEAKSTILSPGTPRFDANHPDPATLTPEQVEQRTALRIELDNQIKYSNEQISALATRANQQTLPQAERDAAVFSAVDQVNRAVARARANATVLGREAFRDGEVEFYNMGEITALIEHISNLLQAYAVKSPSVVEKAVQNLDGHEVQAQIGLEVAIREMTGNQPTLVPMEKPSSDRVAIRDNSNVTDHTELVK